MEPSFWLKKWQDNQIGFHRDHVHPQLEKHFDRLGLEKNQRVFVPLCGKTLDLTWLRSKGLNVDGLEISELAIKSFFEENKIPFEKTQSGHSIFHGNGIHIHQQDLFKLVSKDLPSIDFVYDRAALVALAPHQRSDYSQFMADLLNPGGLYLLIAFSYPQEQYSGPPFSVPGTMVEELYKDNFVIESIDEKVVSETSPKMKASGINSVIETTYIMERR